MIVGFWKFSRTWSFVEDGMFFSDSLALSRCLPAFLSLSICSLVYSLGRSFTPVSIWIKIMSSECINRPIHNHNQSMEMQQHHITSRRKMIMISDVQFVFIFIFIWMCVVVIFIMIFLVIVDVIRSFVFLVHLTMTKINRICMFMYTHIMYCMYDAAIHRWDMGYESFCHRSVSWLFWGFRCLVSECVLLWTHVFQYIGLFFERISLRNMYSEWMRERSEERREAYTHVPILNE